MIKKKMLDTNFCRDENFNKLKIPTAGNPGDILDPKGTKTVHFLNIDLVETIYLKKKKKMKKLATVNTGWSEDLALAICNNTEFGLKESIMIAAMSCERCMNSLAKQYGLPWGYHKYSKEWYEANTQCDFCKDEDFKPFPKVDLKPLNDDKEIAEDTCQAYEPIEDKKGEKLK